MLDGTSRWRRRPAADTSCKIEPMILRLFARRTPSTVAICLLFAAGIAAATVCFSFFHGLFIQALPYPNPEQLVHISLAVRGQAWGIAWKHMEAWQAGTTAFENLAAFHEAGYYLTGPDGEPLHVVGAATAYETVDVLGIKVVRGRNFLAEEDSKTAKPVALMSYSMWQNRFGAAESVIGKTVYLDHRPFEIVGVLPRNAIYPADADFWIPLRHFEDPNVTNREGIGRLRSGVTPEQAAAELNRIITLRQDLFKPETQTRAVVERLREHDVQRFAPMLALVNAAVVGLFLIVCGNASGMLLSLGIARRREFSIRLALGASPWRVMRLLLGESLVLGGIGGALGIALSVALLRALLALMPDVLPSWVTIRVDGWSLAFAVAATMVASLAAGLLPAVQFSRSDEIAPRGNTIGPHRGMNWLAVAQIALATMVLTAGGLVLKAYQRVNSVSLGFEADQTVSFALDPWIQDPEKTVRFYGDYVERLRAVPGVRAVSATFEPPLGAGRGVEVFPVTADYAFAAKVPMHTVTPNYFGTLGIRLAAGRDFGFNESKDSVIINEAFARRAWPGELAVGKVLGPPMAKARHPVVGVVADSRSQGPETAIVPEIYVPHTAIPFSQMYVMIRGDFEPRAIVKEAAQIVRQFDPGVTPFDVQTLRGRMNRLMWLRRTYSWALFVFSGLALGLITLGLYAVLTRQVSERRRELGIRVAVGAMRHDIAAIVLRRALALTGTGVFIGLVCAVFLNHRLLPMLAGGSDRDLGSYGVALSAVAISAILAAWIPAHRAASVDPNEVLRAD